MRTTVDLPEDLLRVAKARAAGQRTTLSNVVAEALRAFVERPQGEEGPFEVLVRGQPGGPYPSPARVQELLDEQEWEGFR